MFDGGTRWATFGAMAQQEDGKRHGHRWWIVAGITLVIVILIAAGGIFIRSRDESALAKQTNDDAVPNVDVIRPQHNAPEATLRLPGNVQAWFEAPIYAQVSGYLRMWYKDIGAVVKAGDLLGEIDAPELDQQLHEARARVAAARTNEKLAEVTAARWQRLLPTQSVSQQSVDVAVSDAIAKRAAVMAAEADVQRLEALEGFKRLVAPFDGVVTVRRTDVGALIKADSVPGPELFAVADIHAMRVYVRVPQSYAAQVHVGMQAVLHLPDYPDRAFPARVITTSHQIKEASRTMLVELEAPNPGGLLSPGSYATVDFRLQPNPQALILPTSALIFQEHGMQVATVGKNGKVALKQIRIARDYGTEVEVVAGIGPNDAVIDEPPDSITDGETVRVAGHHGAPPNRSAANAPEPGE
jgi:RND family efflux transporter MFP subunit